MKKIKILTIILLSLCLIILLIFQQFTKYSEEVISDIADSEIMQFCQLVVNAAAYNLNDLSGDFLVVERDEQGNIELLDFDMTLATKVATQLITDLESLFYDIEDGNFVSNGTIYDSRIKKIVDQKGVITSVPLGALTKNIFLSHYGPNINVKYQTVNRIASEVIKEVESYGLNHIMISLEIKLTIYMSAKVPFSNKEYVKEIRYPLILEIMQGDVPNWYQN